MAYGEKTPGLPQYSIKKYAEAFEVIPRTLAESAGLDATEVLSRLYTAHHKKDDWTTGVDIENDDNTGILDAREAGILDLLIAKHWAIKLATEAVRTVLSGMSTFSPSLLYVEIVLTFRSRPDHCRETGGRPKASSAKRELG